MRPLSLFWIVPVLLVLLFCPIVTAQEGGAAREGGEAGAAPAGGTAADDALAASAESGVGQVSLKQVIKWGGAIGYFIIFLSIVTLMLVAFHLIILRRTKMYPGSVRAKLNELFKEKKFTEAAEYVQGEPSLLGRIVSGGLSRARGGYADMEQVMTDVAEDEAMRLEQGVGYFSLIAAISPLCGLLGTVVGMILAFNEIATRGVVTPAQLARPIEQALVTTCFGLIVAIPNVVAYTFFRNKLHLLLADLSLVVEDLMTPFRGSGPILSVAKATARTPTPGPAASKAPAAEEKKVK